MTPLRLAAALAVETGRFLLKNQPGRRKIAFKGAPGNLVTDMDLASEERIVGAIRRTFPDHAVVAEERGTTQADSPHRWYVDPLDGTTNYAHGFALWCVSIAFESRGRMEAGVVYCPALDELYVGVRDRGATRNRKPIRCSRAASLPRALLATGFPYQQRYKVENLRYWDAFIRRAQAVRRVGSAAMDLCWTAAGAFDGFWEFHLGPWDIAAAALIAEEAGALVTDWKGAPVDVFKGEVLAANPRLHGAMKRVLARAAPRR
ncbi:MAG: inositol monophosphatase [Planctomycetes bacterium]|nr:inositol monophosphatase [Planctomycetota bacterium]